MEDKLETGETLMWGLMKRVENGFPPIDFMGDAWACAFNDAVVRARQAIREEEDAGTTANIPS